jgi:ABC-type transport system involved in cytochrome c biogenesis permease component
MTTAESIALPGGDRSTVARRLRRLDRWVETLGDWLNPILVKEARQALKSRQFIITFSLLLIAAWGWTAAAILMLMPRIYYVPSGQTLLIGYYLVLAVPMLLVVPLAAHRSLAAEIDDGTLDLLSVTNLSPMQIITGKLASAALQMMLYFVALVPCVAFCYVLRGVDLPSILGLLGTTVSVGALATVVGLFLAALPKGRGGQLGMLVIMLLLVVITEFAFGRFAFEVISGRVFSNIDANFISITVLAISLTVTAALVLLRASAAELSPPSENRSTPIRLSLLAHHVVVMTTVFYLLLQWGREDEAIIALTYYVGLFWLAVGTLMVGESPVLTPRVRRDLPATFLGRMLRIWLTPGPATGLVFASIAFLTYLMATSVALEMAEAPGVRFARRYEATPHFFALAGYLMLLLTCTRVGMILVRKRANTHPSVALAVLVIVSGTLALVPYAIAVWWNDYRSIDWTYWQLTNWPWTLALLIDGSLSNEVPLIIFGGGLLCLFVTLMTLGPRVLPLRVATPQRVLEALQPASAEAIPAEPIDPLAPDEDS